MVVGWDFGAARAEGAEHWIPDRLPAP